MQAAALGCGHEAVRRVRDVGSAAVGPRGQALPLYHRQHLFSVYVHAPAQFKQRYERGRCAAAGQQAAALPGACSRGAAGKGRGWARRPRIAAPDVAWPVADCAPPRRRPCPDVPPPLAVCRSIFYGRKIGERLVTRWGTHSLVAAARLLLQEALRDPRNQRFLLLSGEGASGLCRRGRPPPRLRAWPAQRPACRVRGQAQSRERLGSVRPPLETRCARHANPPPHRVPSRCRRERRASLAAGPALPADDGGAQEQPEGLRSPHPAGCAGQPPRDGAPAGHPCGRLAQVEPVVGAGRARGRGG